MDRTQSGATTPGQSRLGSDGIEGFALQSPKLQYYWSLTLRWFSVISKTLIGEVLPTAEMQSEYSATPANRAEKSN